MVNLFNINLTNYVNTKEIEATISKLCFAVLKLQHDPVHQRRSTFPNQFHACIRNDTLVTSDPLAMQTAHPSALTLVTVIRCVNRADLLKVLVFVVVSIVSTGQLWGRKC